MSVEMFPHFAGTDIPAVRSANSSCAFGQNKLTQTWEGGYRGNSERLFRSTQHIKTAIKVSVAKVTAKVANGMFPDLFNTSIHVCD
jgi:hypothetical protein